ncbi:hypothetical protein NMY22_g6684 [Coprinellus aureogranulatus]|nr:hypothetical protein NMY22_g6684 [Coprinellus aureogranulatus]
MASPITPAPISKELEDQLSQLPKKRDSIDLRGLISFATDERSKRYETSDTALQCTSISFLGSGTFHYVYQLRFTDGTRLAASVTNDGEGSFSPNSFKSEIATMKFVRESGLYPGVPVPEVHAWDATFQNLVGAPFVLMDVVEGVHIDSASFDKESEHGRLVTRFDILPAVQQRAIVKALARLQASLSKPLPYDRLGAMVLDPTAPGGYAFGPILGDDPDGVSSEDKNARRRESINSVQELWYAHLENQMDYALEHWCSLENDVVTVAGMPIRLSPQMFSDAYQKITALVPHFIPPKPYDTLVLHHPDIAFRNVFFDKESLASGSPKITGVIDWSGAQIRPLMLTATFPGDLMSNSTTPFAPARWGFPEREPHPFADWWLSVPYDWTSFSDVSKHEKVDGSKERLTKSVSARIRRYHLRTHFSACYASQMYELHGDKDLARSTLFSDATYYLKFDEVVRSDVWAWGSYTPWIDETYWRLRTLGKVEPQAKEVEGGPPLVVGCSVCGLLGPYACHISPTQHFVYERTYCFLQT